MNASCPQGTQCGELVQALIALEQIGSQCIELFDMSKTGNIVNYQHGFEKIAEVSRTIKGQQVKNSGIFWVIDILEAEINK
jgi:hypothetical protein